MDYIICANALRDIPKDLLDLFIPKNNIEARALENAYNALQRREIVRYTVMDLQKKFNLPFNPNESLAHVKTRVMIKQKLNEMNKLPGQDEKEKSENDD